MNLGNQAPIEIGGSQAPVEMGTIGGGGNPFGSMFFETRFYDVQRYLKNWGVGGCIAFQWCSGLGDNAYLVYNVFM